MEAKPHPAETAGENLSDLFDESNDLMGLDVPPEGYTNVPGWVSLEFFLRGKLGITHERALETFRKFYNHYLKRFPVHYFTETSMPGVDFVLFFPARAEIKGVKNPYYLVAISEKDKKLVLFHQSIWNQIKTRQNFFRLTQKWMQEGFSNSKIKGYDIEEILRICEKPEELMAYRRARFSGFLDRLQHKLKKIRLERPFEGKWGDIRQFLEARDKHYIHLIVERIKNEHISFEAARQAASVSRNNLDIYNWMMAAPEEEKIRNRMQLAEHLPWLAKALSMETHSAEYAEVQQAVDAGQRLIPVLQEFLSDDPAHPISQSTVRKTLRLTIQDKYLAPSLLRKLLRMVDDHLPSITLTEGVLENLDEGQSKARLTFEYLNTSFAEIMGHTPSDVRDQILAHDGFGGRVKQFADTVDFMRQVYARLVLAYFANRAHQAGQMGLSDVAQNYLRGELWQTSFLDVEQEGEQHPPSFVESNARHQRHPPYLRPFGNMAFHNIVKLSVAWHADLKSYNTKMSGVDVEKDVRWPALCEDIIAPNGVTIKALLSKRQLQREHEEMGHCINDYAPQCLGLIVDKDNGSRTYSHIFTLETRDGRQRATLELHEPFYGGATRKVTFGQIDQRRKIKEVMNPPDEKSPLRVAAKWMMDMINTGKWHVDWARIDRERAQAQVGRPLKNIAIQVGFDPADSEKCEEAYYLMQPYLPERFRHYSYAQWISKMGFDREADRLFAPEAPALSLSDFVQMDMALRL